MDRAKDFPLVNIFSGPVIGRIENGVTIFKGIRYGASPACVERFKPSRRPQPRAEPADAASFGAAAIQMPMGLADVGEPSAIKTALAPILPHPEDKATESEDCLFLNVWTPGTGEAARRPVMIWLHG